jgi:hypothetical protein
MLTTATLSLLTEPAALTTSYITTPQPYFTTTAQVTVVDTTSVAPTTTVVLETTTTGSDDGILFLPFLLKMKTRDFPKRFHPVWSFNLKLTDFGLNLML